MSDWSGVGDWISNLFGGGGGSMSGLDPSTFPVPPIPPDFPDPGGTATPESASFPVPPIPPNFPDPSASSSTGGGIGGALGQLGGALKDLKMPGDVNKSQAQKVQIDQTKAPLGQAGQGARNLAALIQLLQQRDMSYFPAGGSSGRPINQSPTTGGLLGF
jgi:hypothetical protein